MAALSAIKVLVGMGLILLDGVVVEDDVMIGAGSLVLQNKRLESGYLYFGNPVKSAPDGGGTGRSALFSKQLCEMEKRLSGSGEPHPALIIFLLVVDQYFSLFFQIPAMATKRGQPLLGVSPSKRCLTLPLIAQVSCIPLTSTGKVTHCRSVSHFSVRKLNRLIHVFSSLCKA